MFQKSDGNHYSLATFINAGCIFHFSVYLYIDGSMCRVLKSAFRVTAKYPWKWSSKHSADVWRALQIKKGFQTFISGTVHQVLKYNKYKIMLKKNQCLCTNIKTNATTATSSWTSDTKTCSDCHLICCYAQGSYFELWVTAISVLLGRL